MGTNRRYKPKFKRLLKLRFDNFQKKNILSFQKKKWHFFFFFLKNKKKRRGNNFYLYDHGRFINSSFIFRFKRKFKFDLNLKQKFFFYYSSVKQKFFKKVTGKLLSAKNLSPQEIIVQTLESRLDSVLYRSLFVSTRDEAKQFIKHKHVFVNRKKVIDCSYILKKGDVITIDLKKKDQVKANILNSNIWPLPPEYLETNYKTLTIIYVKLPDINQLYSHYPFFVSFNTINY